MKGYEMRSIICLTMICVCLACARPIELEEITPMETDTTAVCIHSIAQLKQLNNNLDTFKIIRVVLDGGEEIIPDGLNVSVGYRIKPSSGGSSLFDSSLTIRALEDNVFKTYFSNVWSKGCRNSLTPAGNYTN